MREWPVAEASCLGKTMPTSSMMGKKNPRKLGDLVDAKGFKLWGRGVGRSLSGGESLAQDASAANAAVHAAFAARAR
jgi:hypothetical protein